MRYIVTTVGTSLITNIARRRGDQSLVTELYRHANDSEPHSPEFGKTVRELADEALAEGVLSAEMSTLAAYEAKKGAIGPMDYHRLVATDTFQGQVCAEALRTYFAETRGQNTDILPVRGLRTDSVRSFHEAMTDFMGKFDEDYGKTKLGAQEDLSLVFNLAGGFKALTQFMAIIGLLYEAETYYRFESSNDLIKIPSIPIRIDYDPDEEAAKTLEFMLQGAVIPAVELPEGLPDAFYYVDENGDAIISAFGAALWKSQLRERKLSEQLIQWPHLEYENRFLEDAKRCQPDERKRLNETLAEMALIIEETGDPGALKGHPGLQAEKLRNVAGGRYEHARVSQGLRVSYEVDGKVLRMRRFGKEPDVNKNP